MYSINTIDKRDLDVVQGSQTLAPTRQHQDISPELKEVMHLLHMIETGRNTK